MANTLKLPRDILAKFLPDHRSIIAFEKMFVEIDENQSTNLELINNVSLAADGANTNAVLALALAEVMQQLAELSATSPVNVDEENEYLDGRQEVAQDDVLLGRTEQPLEQDTVTLNPIAYALQNNQIGFNGTSVLVGDTALNTCQYIMVTNNSAASLVNGDVVAIVGSTIQKYDGTGHVIGVAKDNMAISAQGRLVTSGVIAMDTSLWSVGDKLYNDGVSTNTTSGIDIGIVTAINQVLVRL